MASREAAPRPEVKWERADIGEDEKNAPLPTPPGQAPPASAADDAEESEYITVESPYISIGELVDIGDDSDIDVDDEEESDDLFLNRMETVLGLDDFNRLIRIVKSGSEAIFTVPQGSHEPPARARLNTLDLWNSFDEEEEEGDVVVDLDFDPFASIKKRRNSTYSRRRGNSRSSIRRGSFRGPGFANRDVLDETIHEDGPERSESTLSTSSGDPFSGFGGVKNKEAIPDALSVSPVAKPKDPFASFSGGEGPLAKPASTSPTSPLAGGAGAPANRRAVWAEANGPKNDEPRRLTGLGDDAAARMEANKARLAESPSDEGSPKRERVLSGLPSRRERVSSGADMQKPQPESGPVTQRSHKGVQPPRSMRAKTTSPGVSPSGGRGRLMSTGRSGTPERASPAEPEFMSRLSAFKATWVEQGLARRPEEDVVDEVLATVNTLAKVEDTPNKEVLQRRLSISVERGELPVDKVNVVVEHMDATMRKLVEGIQMCGIPSANKGTHVVKFGTLNGQIGSHFDNLGGLLRAAREKNIVNYRGYLLIPGLSDDVYIELLKYELPSSTPDSYTVEQVRLISSTPDDAPPEDEADTTAPEVPPPTAASAAAAAAARAKTTSPLKSVVTAPPKASTAPPRASAAPPKPASSVAPRPASTATAAANTKAKAEGDAAATAAPPKPASTAPPKAAFNPFGKKKAAASQGDGGGEAEGASKKFNPFGKNNRNAASRLAVLSMKRVKAAADWADKEIRKLIAAIKECGEQNAEKKWAVAFGTLFSHTENTMEALAGTLKSAKQRGVVTYAAEVLMQRYHDNVIITLEKETFEPTAETPERPMREVQPPAGRTSGFEHGWTNGCKCDVCGKTVYQAEYVGASGKSYHAKCFACIGCKKLLTQTTYSVSRDGGVRCAKCHREFELA